MSSKRHSAGLPPSLLEGATRVLRPRDAAGSYRYPGPEFRRLSSRGLLERLATGYYAIVPQGRAGASDWRPSISDAALGIAVADYGRERVALMGPSAARHHGLIPRELSMAVVGVPVQRPALEVLGGRVQFVRRDVSRLDLVRISTELGDGWVTSLEQTVLDLMSRSDRFGLPHLELMASIDQAAGRLDWELTKDLARDQRKLAAYERLRARVAPDDA
jgi:predicted transcriptional regulator of viral defense system